LTKYLFPVN